MSFRFLLVSLLLNVISGLLVAFLLGLWLAANVVVPLFVPLLCCREKRTKSPRVGARGYFLFGDIMSFRFLAYIIAPARAPCNIYFLFPSVV